jgi:pimeloyl-ACP methyl ester carboxylesterase
MIIKLILLLNCIIQSKSYIHTTIKYSNSRDTTMLLNRFTNRFNIKNTLLEINKDIYSFLQEDKNLGERKTILNFPGFRNISYIKEHDITFVNSVDNKFSKKSLLYLPGIDMSAVSFYSTYLSLKSEYDIHTVVSGFNTNITFDDLSSYIKLYINAHIKDKDLLIIGESFGALPSINIIPYIQEKKRIKLILINPATSYHKSIWYKKFNNTEISNSVLLDVINHGPSIMDIFKSIHYLKSKYPNESKWHTYGYFYIFINLFNIPSTYINYRVINWIDYGIMQILENNSLLKLNCETLLLAGENDDFLPSSEEVKYLSTQIKNSKYIIIPECSHYISVMNCNLYDLIKKNL